VDVIDGEVDKGAYLMHTSDFDVLDIVGKGVELMWWDFFPVCHQNNDMFVARFVMDAVDDTMEDTIDVTGIVDE